MARPNRGKYPTGAEGHASFRKDLAKWLKDQKAAKAKANKITSTKKNIDKQKKPAVKKTAPKTVKDLAKKKPTSATKKPPVKKTPVKKTPVKPDTVKKKVINTPKKAAKKVVNKPVLTPKQKLQIKKGLKTAADTSKKVAGAGVKRGKQFIKDTKAKVKPYQDSLKKYKAKKPTTKLQKWASKGNDALKKAGKYTKKQVLPKAGKDLLKIWKHVKEPKNFGKNVSGLKGFGLSVAANMATDAAMTRVFKGKRSVAEYKKDRERWKRHTDPTRGAGRTIKGISNKVRGKAWHENNMSDQEKHYEKIGHRTYKKSAVNKDLKINKSSDYMGGDGKKKNNKNNKSNNNSNNKSNNKNQKPIVRSVGKTDFNIATKGGKDAYNRALLKSGEPRPGSARAKMRAKNVERFGKPHVDRLVKKNKEFQEIKRIKDRNERKKRREGYRQKYGR